MARKVSDDERALWRAATRSVAPLRRKRARAEHAPADLALSMRAAGEPMLRKGKPASTPRPTPPAKLQPAAEPAAAPTLRLERRVKQRLARGTESIDARIDLHGRTQSQAYDALLRFLQKRQADGARIVLVITGKGAGDLGERGVLKRQVPLWLAQPEFRGYVLAIEDAHLAHGGSGALYVRLRRARHERNDPK